MAFTIGLLVGKKGKRKKKLLRLLLPNFFGKNLRRRTQEEEVEEKEEEGAYYARTILTKVSHRAPLGRDQTIVPPCTRAARARMQPSPFVLIRT